MSIQDCKFQTFNKVNDPRGNLVFAESLKDIPFDIKRIYYLFDVPYGSERGGHAHKRLQQIIIALSGSFDLILNDGVNEKIVRMSNPGEGLYICPGIWRELRNFTSGAVCFVLASDHYDESDYIRGFEEFLRYKNG